MPDAPLLKLFGTEEPVPPLRLLTAGSLSVCFDAGNLRTIRHHGLEVIRGIAFLVRDKDWGTLPAVLSDLEIDEAPDRFRVRYRARCTAETTFTYGAEITGSADGRLTFAAEGSPEQDFLTNRLGFIVLHPLEGVVGRPLTVEHTDGTRETITIPELVSPDQPALDIRALTNEPADGLVVSCRMEGDAFEMEDQRNWTDASLKTYIRPVSRPRPFVVSAGERVEQGVILSLTGSPTLRDVLPMARGHGAEVPRIAIGIPAGTAGLVGITALEALAPSRLIARLDARKPLDAPELARLSALKATLCCLLTVELILPAEDADAELAAVRDGFKDAGLEPDSLIAVGAYDLRMRPSNASPPGGGESPARLVAAARRLFPRVEIGSGAFTGFPEFNRNPPPPADFVTHTTSAIVHAADDLSVMETLEALPHVFHSAAALCGGRPYRIGPSGIGLRINPAGSGVPDNPANGRVPMASRDPRQDGLFAAAWTLGYLVKAAAAGVDEVALADASGDFGVLRPDRPGGLRPLYHVLRGLAAARGSRLAVPEISTPHIAALACEAAAHREVWLANLTGELAGLVIQEPHLFSVLDLHTFEAAELDPRWMDHVRPLPATRFELGPYAVMRLVKVSAA